MSAIRAIKGSPTGVERARIGQEFGAKNTLDDAGGLPGGVEGSIGKEGDDQDRDLVES